MPPVVLYVCFLGMLVVLIAYEGVGWSRVRAVHACTKSFNTL
jgi:hypothetical protein